MKEVSLETIQNGAVIDMFNEELQKVMQNIADENTNIREKCPGITVLA